MPTVNLPRIMMAAASSGSGKTTVVCTLLELLRQRNCKAAAFKSGPDYIDPMFHTRVLDTPSYNLDLFLLGRSEKGRQEACRLLGRHGRQKKIAVLEGAMGYYDGIGTGSEASAYELAAATETPVVIVVDGRGSALTLAAVLKGLAVFRKDSHIAGFIVNRMKPMVYDRYYRVWEKESGLTALGYLPDMPDCSFSSRHLGLVTASEIENLQDILGKLADAGAKSLDWDAIMKLARTAPSLAWDEPEMPAPADTVRLAVARDEAFCFYYEDSLDTLRSCGAELIFFSPLHDGSLPDCDGLYLGGGYPELHAQNLSRNGGMLTSIRQAIRQGMPCLAECGGFMYLHDYYRCQDGQLLPWAGVISGETYMTGSLRHFGYVTLEAQQDTLLLSRGETMTAHEFHYSGSTATADACMACKAGSSRQWPSIVARGRLFAGYPHIHLSGYPDCASRFIDACSHFRKEVQP